MADSSKDPCICPDLKNWPTVQIDDDGSFKYILAKIHCGHEEHDFYTVVGHKRLKSYTDIINEVLFIKKSTKPSGRTCDDDIEAPLHSHS